MSRLHKHTSLGDGDDVVAHLDGGDAVSLDGSGRLVATQSNIALHDRVKTSIAERIDGFNACETLLQDVDHVDPVVLE